MKKVAPSLFIFAFAFSLASHGAPRNPVSRPLFFSTNEEREVLSYQKKDHDWYGRPWDRADHLTNAPGDKMGPTILQRSGRGRLGDHNLFLSALYSGRLVHWRDGNLSNHFEQAVFVDIGSALLTGDGAPTCRDLYEDPRVMPHLKTLVATDINDPDSRYVDKYLALSKPLPFPVREVPLALTDVGQFAKLIPAQGPGVSTNGAVPQSDGLTNVPATTPSNSNALKLAAPTSNNPGAAGPISNTSMVVTNQDPGAGALDPLIFRSANSGPDIYYDTDTLKAHFRGMLDFAGKRPLLYFFTVYVLYKGTNDQSFTVLGTVDRQVGFNHRSPAWTKVDWTKRDLGDPEVFSLYGPRVKVLPFKALEKNPAPVARVALPDTNRQAIPPHSNRPGTNQNVNRPSPAK